MNSYLQRHQHKSSFTFSSTLLLASGTQTSHVPSCNSKHLLFFSQPLDFDLLLELEVTAPFFDLTRRFICY